MATTIAPQPEAQEEYAGYPGIRRWIVLAAVMLGTLMQVIDISIVNVAIPEMMGNLGATLDQIGWVSTGYIIANVILLPLTGWLSSTFGRRRYLGTSMILFTAASFACGMSKSLDALIFYRVLQGAAGAALLSTAQATLFEIFPPRQLGLVQAIFGIGVLVGPTVGPTLGGWLTDNYSWPWIFFINLPIGAAAAILTFVFMRDSKYQKTPNGGVDYVGIGFLALGLGCLQMVLEKGRREEWFASPLITWLTIFGTGGMLAFIFWELRARAPAVDLRVLRDRGLAAGTILGAVLGFGLFGGVFILPVFLQNLRHYSAEQTGWILFPGGLASGLMMPVMSRMVMRLPSRNLVLVGMVAFAGSMFMLHDMTMDTGPQHLFLPLALRGAAMGFLFIPLTMAALIGLRGKDIAEGTGLFNVSRQLGGSVGIAFLSTFVDHRIALHRAALAEHVNIYNTLAIQRLQSIAAAMIAKGAAPDVARQQALAILDRSVQGQASVLAFDDAFLVIGIVFLAALPLVLLFEKGTPLARRGRPVPGE